MFRSPANASTLPAHRLIVLGSIVWLFASSQLVLAQSPFAGERGKALDSACWDSIWDQERESAAKKGAGKRGFLKNFVKVPRNEVVGFALYTQQNKTLKMNDSKDVAYRVRHGEEASFEGLIRKTITGKKEIVVGSLSCNSSRDRGGRENIVRNLKIQNPDLLFFAGDQSYDHREHTAAWLLWGTQFRDVIRDRPTITIPDDHDVGQANIWGENGKVATTMAGPSGGYFFPAEYVNMVQRAQTWHLPDPFDAADIENGIGVYFTSLNVGGVDFAILEDRKFKSGPEGKIPAMGPRPDHINQPGYDPAKVDLPTLKLLGDRQLKFLESWGQNWIGAKMKCVLSQTAFCGAVHIHGSADNRLLADLDCNGWPQTGRNKALSLIRKARACHLCGDQHLGVVVKHGIEEFRDGPFAFTSPAIVNTIYGRWWWPEDEKAGGGEALDTGLAWTGDFKDGLYNRITMLAYANPGFANMKEARQQKKEGGKLDLADGYGLVRFDTETGDTTFESWPRFADLREDDAKQFAGWPITFNMMENDGREPVGFLREIDFGAMDLKQPVVQVIDESTGEVQYTTRFRESKLKLPVYSKGPFGVRAGDDLSAAGMSGLMVEQ